MEHILELKNLQKNYPNFNLNMTLDLPKGSILGLVGENGSGKTTTIKLISTVIQKSGGEIRYFGNPHEGITKEDKEHIAICFEELYVYDSFSPRDLDKIMKSIYKTWSSDRFFQLLNRFSLQEGQKIKELSKGMRMKLSLVMALSHDTQLLILDEATSGLDPMVRREVLDILQEFIQDENRSVLISSHITSDLEKVCDYVAFVQNGEVVLYKTVDQLREEFAILKTNKRELDKLPKEVVINYRQSAFGVEALVNRVLATKYVIENAVLEQASIEDVMSFYGKTQVEREVI